MTDFEMRGIDNLVYAEVISDTTSGIVYGEVKSLSPTAEIGKNTENSMEAHYYDNLPLIIVNSEGADTVTIVVMPPALAVLADITGQRFDASRGALIEGSHQPKYFAIGYRAKGTDGKYRYVWRLKGQFSIPDETYKTEDNSTGAENMTITFTGINTMCRFKYDNKSARSVTMDERYVAVDPTQFFGAVITPDTLPSTPGTATPVPEFLPAVSSFRDAISVTIGCSYPSANIYYTTDGSEPTTNDKYTGAFNVTETTTVKAFAARTGGGRSAVVTKTYYKI